MLSRSVLLRLGLPLLVALLYVFVCVKPVTQGRADRTSSALTASESAELWNQSNVLFRDGNYPAALPLLVRLQQSYPGNHIYIEKTAETYGRLGDYRHEAESWERYFDYAPNPVTACPQLGQAYWKQDKQAEAISAFERCLALDPENSDSIFFLAQALERSGQITRAASLYQRGVQLAPGYSDLQIGLARVRLRQGRTAEGEELVNGVLARSPDKLDALLVAGLVSLREGRLAQARAYLERGAKLADGYTDFRRELAEVAEAERNYPEAVRQYERILQDDPKDEQARARRDVLMGKR